MNVLFRGMIGSAHENAALYKQIQRFFICLLIAYVSFIVYVLTHVDQFKDAKLEPTPNDEHKVKQKSIFIRQQEDAANR